MGSMGRNLGRLRGCTCDPWAPDESCPHHGDPQPETGPSVCCWSLDPTAPKPCSPELCTRTTPPTTTKEPTPMATTHSYESDAAARAAQRRYKQATALRKLAGLLDDGTIPELNSGVSVWLDDDGPARLLGTTTSELTTRVIAALNVDLSQTAYETDHHGYRVRSYTASLSDVLDISVWVRVDRTAPEPPDRNPAEDRDEAIADHQLETAELAAADDDQPAPF